MLLEIDGKRYPMVGPGQATLADLVALKRETGVGVAQLQVLAELFDGLEGKELEDAAKEHLDELIWMKALAVWLSRRAAGERLDFEEACSVPFDKIREIAEPSDKAPAKKKAAKKSADPQ